MNGQKFIGLQQNGIGNPEEVVEIIELTIPDLDKDQVLVELIASPINYMDIHGIIGVELEGFEMPSPEFPTLLGGEGIAKVIEIGSEVKNVQVGDNVSILYGSNPWRERFVLSAKNLNSLPKSHPLQLSMLNVSPQTAYGMLTSILKLDKGDWIIQNAANSTVGCFVIGLAKWMGLKIINIVRREELVEQLKTLGADHVLVDAPDLVQKIMQLKNIGPIKLGLDAVGGNATNTLVAALTPGGTIISYGFLGGQYMSLNIPFLVMKNIRVQGFYAGYWAQTTNLEDQITFKKELIDLIRKDQLKIPIEKTYPLRDYKEALTHASKFGRKGKILFTGPAYSEIK